MRGGRNPYRKYYVDKEKRIPLPPTVRSNVNLQLDKFQPLKLILVLLGIIIVITLLKWQILTITEHVQSAQVKDQQKLRVDSLKYGNQADQKRELIGFYESSPSLQSFEEQDYEAKLGQKTLSVQDDADVSLNSYENNNWRQFEAEQHGDNETQDMVQYPKFRTGAKLDIVTTTTLFNKLHGIVEEPIPKDGLVFHEIERWKTNKPKISNYDGNYIPGDGTASRMRNPAIVVFCFNRSEYLRRTLTSLSQQRGLSEFTLYISQDGNDGPVAQIASQMGKGSLSPPNTKHFEHWQHPRLPLLGQRQPGHAWLAQHYKWALDRAFLEKDHSHVIIVEDDMLFSPDFLQLFKTTSVLLDLDSSLWCISSWNDNGVQNFDWQSDRLFRTTFFPGLGWMLTQKLWAEIGGSWPLENWDHWMRLETTNLGRQCIAPEVNRNFNIGEKGANMNKSIYKRYLSKMAFNKNDPVWDFGDLSYLLKPNYEKMIKNKMEKAMVMYYNGPQSMPVDQSGTMYLILYQIEQYKMLSKMIGIWPFPRGHYNHITVVPRKSGQTLLLADVRLCPLLDSTQRLIPTPSLFVAAGERGQSCDEVCRNENAFCQVRDFQFINSCMQLQQKFPCERGCGLVLGPDVPNYVMNPELDTHSLCLVNEATFKCAGQHPSTARLCPCVK